METGPTQGQWQEYLDAKKIHAESPFRDVVTFLELIESSVLMKKGQLNRTDATVFVKLKNIQAGLDELKGKPPAWAADIIARLDKIEALLTPVQK